MTIENRDFNLTFLKKGAVINARHMPDTMDDSGLTFTYDADDGENYIIFMDRKGRFSAERFGFVEDEGWDYFPKHPQGCH